MKTLLIHLSDIHIKTGDDPILSRGKKIVDAVKNLEPSVNSAIIVVSGDTTYSGTEDQYLYSIDFLTGLKSDLQLHLGEAKPIKFASVPGNHDCDFSAGGEARSMLLDAVRQDPRRLLDKTFSDVIIAPLKRYFDFLQALDDSYLFVTKGLFWEYSFTISGTSFAIRCINSAATSAFREQPGALALPPEAIPNCLASADVSIGVVHHPYNWFSPNCMRELRRRIEGCTDLILTGHEHAIDKRETNSRGNNNTYLEGGVLQDSGNSANSAFYAIIIDAASKKQRILSFAWQDDRYKAQNCEDPAQYHIWEDFTINRLRLRDTFRIQPSFSTFLDDPEITLTHRSRGILHLSDIYVYPDLKRINLNNERQTKLIAGERIPEFISQNPCVFIVGDELAGKTALSKRLFSQLRTDGDIPIYIDAAKSAITTKSCERHLEEAFLRCYSPDNLDAYRQLDRARRVLIIDNYHKLRLSPTNKIELLQQLRQHSFRIVVLAHDLELTFQDLAESGESLSGELPFVYYCILPFSGVRRDRLVEKWLLLNSETQNDTSEYVHNLQRITSTINTLIGKNYVPAFPSYVLAVLQATETGTDVDIQASTHGYLYELFIKSTIAKHGTISGLNITLGYLAHLAYRLFKSGSAKISEVNLRQLHAELNAEYEVLPDFDVNLKRLIQVQMIVSAGDCYMFRHRYIYYYFLASYLSEHISSGETHGEIQEMAETLFREDSANTLLFLAHLSKDKFILDTLLAAAERQYPESPAATLNEDVVFLNEIDCTVDKLTLPDHSPTESRTAMLESEESHKEEEEVFEAQRKSDFENADSALGKLNAALKTVQILGQFLKNFPVDIGKSDKERMITSCTSLVRRALASYLNLVKENKVQFLEEMVFLISRHKQQMPDNKLKGQAAMAVVGFCELFTTGVIYRLTYAIGSSQLSTIYDRLFPQYQEPILRLAYISLHLDHYEIFPESLVQDEIRALRDNPFAFRILRFLVARHFALFPVDFRLKQRMSEKLQFDYRKLRIAKPEQQLLA